MKKLIPFLALFVLLAFVSAPLAYAAETEPDPGIPTDSSGNPYTQEAVDAANNASQSGVNAAVTNTSASNQSGFTALAPITGLTDTANTSAVNATSLANFFNNLYKYVIGMAAVLAIIMIIWSGLEIALNKDSVSKALEAKGRITQAIYGLVLVLAPVLVFSIINPSILNLSLNLPELKTTASNSSTGVNYGAVDPASGCEVTGTAGILQIAKCPSSGAANDWGKTCTGKLSIGLTNKLTDGTIVSTFLICASSKNYVFISDKTASLPVNLISPLAVTSDNPNNGSEVMQFMNICRSTGRQTCISNGSTSLWTFSKTCLPVPKFSSSDSNLGKCYNETLSCEDTSFTTNASFYCSGSPNWTPIQ